MSADGVKAGRAYVELSVKDRLTKGLAQAKERLAGWAKGLALTGTAIQAGSASVLTALGAAVHHFADQGSRLNDMSVATGVSVETLSGLGYAAQQTGVDLGSLQGGLKGLAKFTGNVAAGSKGAIHTLQQLGISASTFLAASPEQRLGLLADGLRAIQDPGVRAALAMKTLGRAGESLLPMLADGSAGLDAFMERARELGIVITGEEAAKADALADTMQALIATAITGAQAVLEFVRSNQGLVVALATAAVAGMVLGGVFLTLAAFGFALAGLEVAYRQGLLAIRTLWSGFKEWLVGLFADMFAGIFQMLADFQAKLVGGVNYIREKLGFEPIQGLQFVDDWAAGAADKAGEMKADAARNREQEVQASRDRLGQAQRRLDTATDAAHQARTDQAEKRKKKFTGLLDNMSDSPRVQVTAPGGSTLGTFSAAVAGLLGRSGPDTAAERTANATEAMEEHLAAIRDDVEEGGLAFE